MTTSYLLPMSRRMFASSLIAGGGGLAATAGLGGLAVKAQAASGNGKELSFPPGFPHQDPKLVREVVLYSHFNIDAVRELITARPELSKSAWDWGFGDWESALGAASHMGNRDMAALLMEYGARPDIFTFTMLGNLSAVKAIVEAQPGVQRIPGPHGITLFSHAINGGDEASDVAAYLKELGDANNGATNKPLTTEQIAMYVGTYRVDESAQGVFDITEARGMLAFKYGEDTNRRLMHQGNHEFHPGGAPGVRFRFEVNNGVATGLSIHDSDTVIKARRDGRGGASP